MNAAFTVRDVLSPPPFLRRAGVRMILSALLAAGLLAALLVVPAGINLSGAGYGTDQHATPFLQPADGPYDRAGDDARDGSGFPLVPLEKQALFEQVKVAESADELCKLLGPLVLFGSGFLHAREADPGLKLLFGEAELEDTALPVQLLKRPPPFTG